MSVPMGEFLGFTYNGIHSSSFGIVRTSDGSRFNKNLLPPFQDKIVPIPGGDGAYYFGSTYGPKQFNVAFAFDQLKEEDLKGMQQWLGDKKIHPLIFDELPYKQYQAKVTGTASIKYIPFSEGETNRLYKGEGSISFTAYYPFAFAPYKTLGEYYRYIRAINPKENYRKNKYYIREGYGYKLCEDEKYNSNYEYYEIDTSNWKDEWKHSSGIRENLDDFDILSDNTIKLYNPGDLETDWILTIPFIERFNPLKGKNDKYIPGLTLYLQNNGFQEKNNFLELSEIISKTSDYDSLDNLDTEIRINSKNNLIEGYIYNEKSGNIYNEAILDGQFFKIPKTINQQSNFIIDNKDPHVSLKISKKPLEYNYIYY